MNKILIINGPNLNLLGLREKEYGEYSLDEIQDLTNDKLREVCELSWIQENGEDKIVEAIQSIHNSSYQGLIINPGAYSHYSIAILDALKTLKIPIVEVHLSQLYKRENFRQSLLTGSAASLIMTGLQENSYYHGALALCTLINEKG